MTKKELLIIECIPKSDDVKDGRILYEFLKMTIPGKVALKEIGSKNELINFLKKKDNVKGYNYFHLSGHGDSDDRTFSTPKGSLEPEDFPENCFEETTVTLSSCTLGKFNFIDPFMDQAFPRRVIAPQKDIEFIDAAMWFVTFYFWALHHDMRPSNAFDRTADYFKGKVTGAMQYWDQ